MDMVRDVMLVKSAIPRIWKFRKSRDERKQVTSKETISWNFPIYF